MTKKLGISKCGVQYSPTRKELTDLNIDKTGTGKRKITSKVEDKNLIIIKRNRKSICQLLTYVVTCVVK